MAALALVLSVIAAQSAADGDGRAGAGPVPATAPASQPLKVSGTSTCPSPDAVRERLEQLLPPGKQHLQRAQLSTTQGFVHIAFLSPDGAQLAERSLPAQGSCDELADAVAVVVAAWEAELDGQAVAAEAPEPLRLEFEAAALGSLAGGQLAPGGLLGVAAGPRGSRWGGRLTLSATGPRQVKLGTGSVQWLRATAELGPRFRVWDGGVLVELGVQLLAAIDFFKGLGYPEAASSLGFDPGLGGGVRAILPFTRWSLWAEFAASGYFLRHHLVVDGAPGEVVVPPVELTLRVGFAIGRP